MGPQRRFTWQEMKEYWRVHSSRWAGINYAVDPDGLGNVCFAGAPLWLNRYYARSQMMVYQKLFKRLPTVGTRKRALEVGCGAGRWCRFLNDRGYETVGIDLQPELIEMNRVRYPNIKFYCISVQDYLAEEPFDLISAVTVVQHIPFDEQGVVFQKFRDIMRVGGHIIMLDSIHYQTPHVFSNTVREWQTKVEKAGFRCIAIQRYDYTPFLRFYSCMEQRIMLMLRQGVLNEAALTPEALVASPPVASSTGGRRNFFGWLAGALTRLSLGLDTLVEPVLVQSNIPLLARHCGFLFRAI